MKLATLYVCAACPAEGGEWSMLLWVRGCSWWVVA